MDFQAIICILWPAMSREIQFLFGQHVRRCTHRIDKQFEYYVLQYMDGGKVSLRIGEADYDLEGRYFWSSYPGPRIRFNSAAAGKTWVHRYLAFSGPVVKRWIAAGFFPIAPQRPGVASDDYAERFDALLEHALRTDQYSHLRALHLLEGILLDLAEARTESKQQPAWLVTTLQRLQNGVALDYSAIARDAGFSERSLRRKFQSAVGMSPHEYVLHARMAKARQLLGETDLPAKVIAQRLGYRDVYFFSRQFRELTGVPPVTYRKSRQA